jgi:hypothetical protein
MHSVFLAKSGVTTTQAAWQAGKQVDERRQIV